MEKEAVKENEERKAKREAKEERNKRRLKNLAVVKDQE